jgi:hypothetical protein
MLALLVLALPPVVNAWPRGSRKGLWMDVGEVVAYAQSFARAVVRNDSEQIPSYLVERQKARIEAVLREIPQPLKDAEVLRVYPPKDGECVSLIKFSGGQWEALLRAVWVEPLEQIGVKEAQIVASSQLANRDS